MATEEIGALRALLTATSAVFEKDMKAARDSVRNHGGAMQKSLSEIGKKFGNATVMLGKYAAAAGATAATGFAYFLKTQIDAADQIGKVAQATGQTTEFISSMGYVAQQSGTSIDKVSVSMRMLSKNMDDFRRGSGEAKVAFETLGITVQNNDGTLRSSESVFLDIADKLSKLADGSEKTALAVRLFGESGSELIPMLNQGRAGIEALQNQAKELGLVISSETAAQAAFFNDELNRLKQEAVGAGRAIVVDMLPGLVQAVKDIRKAKEESGLLTAGWVALGAAAKAIFSKTTQNQINQLTKDIALYEKEITEATERISGRSIFSVIANKEDEARIIIATDLLEKARVKLVELQAQHEKEKAAEKERMDASIAAAKKEAEEREANLKRLIDERTQQQKISEDKAKDTAAEEARIKAAKAAQEAIQGTIQSLELQRDTFGMTTEAATLYKISLMDGITPAQLEVAKGILETIKAQQELNAIMDEGKSIFDSTRTPAEKYAATVARLNQLLAAGAIDQETFNRAIKDAQDALNGLADTTEDKFEDLKRTIEGWGRSSTDALVDFAMTGQKSFKDLADSIIKDILRMLIYQNMIKPLFNSISNIKWGGGGGGGNMTSEGVTFPISDKLATGGPAISGRTYLVGENGPEILQMGNQGGYVHSNDSIGGGGGDVTVNINNMAGVEIKTSQKTTAQGQELDIVIDNVVSSKLGQFGSSSNRTLRQLGGRLPLTQR